MNPSTRPIRIGAEPPTERDVVRLLAANSALSASLYPTEGNFALDPHAFDGPDAHVLVARSAEGQPMGCVGLLVVRDGAETVAVWGEMKSFYVAPAARGAKLGLKLLAALEEYAFGLRLQLIRLETGPLNPAAIELYRRSGYAERGPFGSYTYSPYSIFMEKALSR